MSETSDLLEKSALIFLYNFHREHSWLKSIIKKLSPKINVKNIKNRVLKKSYRNTIRVSNGLDPVQDRCSVSPDLGPNYLQRLNADEKSHC